MASLPFGVRHFKHPRKEPILPLLRMLKPEILFRDLVALIWSRFDVRELESTTPRRTCTRGRSYEPYTASAKPAAMDPITSSISDGSYRDSDAEECSRQDIGRIVQSQTDTRHADNEERVAISDRTNLPRYEENRCGQREEQNCMIAWKGTPSPQCCWAGG